MQHMPLLARVRVGHENLKKIILCILLCQLRVPAEHKSFRNDDF